MDGGNEICCSPMIPLHVYRDGDFVHVFEGTGVGKVNNRVAGWFGRVVGREGNTYLVKNRLLTAKGSPTRVDGQYMRLQRDFTLGSGGEERVHSRSLSKRTRDRILSSADEHNNDMRSTAERTLAHVKKQKSQESQAHFLRRELGFWQGKCDTLEKQKDALKDHKKTTLKKIEVWHYLVLSF